MKCLILCGGLGTRLRSAVADRPKSLAPISGRPFLAWTLDALRAQNQSDFVLSAGYLADQIAVFADEYRQMASDPKLNIQVVTEPKPLGTGGAIRYAIQTASLSSPFLAINGDTFFNGSVQKLVDFYQNCGGLAAIALTKVSDASRYGRVIFEPEAGAVKGFLEKKDAQPTPAWINAGFYLLNPTLFDIPNLPEVLSLEQDVFPKLSKKRQLFACSFSEKLFLDIGTPEDFVRAEAFLPTFRKTLLTTIIDL